MSEQVNEVTGEIVPADATTRNIGQEIANINEGTMSYSSIKGTGMDAKLAVLTAMSNAVPLADHLNKALNIKDILIQTVQLPNDKTGALEEAPRITIIDADGSAYSATSIGIFSSVKQLIVVMGEPESWTAPVAAFAVEEKGSKPGYKYMTLKYGTPAK